MANRVGEMQMFSDPQQWQHVSTEQNPSELVSRGVNVEGPQRERIMVDRSRLVAEERRQLAKSF